MTSDGPGPVAPWTSSAFVDEVRAWVAAQLAPHGVRLSGEWQQPHARVWSSTIRFETTEGRFWFKVNGSGTTYEASLVALLGELSPGLVPEVIALDKARAWTLTRHAGPVLRSKAPPDALWWHWENLLPRYAEAQLNLAKDWRQLLATGAPDRRPGSQRNRPRAWRARYRSTRTIAPSWPRPACPTAFSMMTCTPTMSVGRVIRTR